MNLCFCVKTTFCIKVLFLFYKREKLATFLYKLKHAKMQKMCSTFWAFSYRFYEIASFVFMFVFFTCFVGVLKTKNIHVCYTQIFTNALHDVSHLFFFCL
jgi:hypothetical protein